MRLNPLYAPDGMISSGRSTDCFDDGLGAQSPLGCHRRGSVSVAGRGVGDGIQTQQRIRGFVVPERRHYCAHA